LLFPSWAVLRFRTLLLLLRRSWGFGWPRFGYAWLPFWLRFDLFFFVSELCCSSSSSSSSVARGVSCWPRFGLGWLPFWLHLLVGLRVGSVLAWLGTGSRFLYRVLARVISFSLLFSQSCSRSFLIHVLSRCLYHFLSRGLSHVLFRFLSRVIVRVLSRCLVRLILSCSRSFCIWCSLLLYLVSSLVLSLVFSRVFCFL
jgi:hypothetical protein